MSSNSTVARAPSDLQKPRILVLTSTYPRWPGDTEPRFILDLCRHLSEYADVLVLAPHTPGAAKDEWIEGVHVKRYTYFIPRWQSVTYCGGMVARLRSNRWRLLQLPFFFAGLCWALRRAIRTWSPNVVHSHWILPQGLAACLMTPAHIPVLCTSHGGDLHALRARLFTKLKSWTLKRSHYVTVVGQGMLPLLRAMLPGRPADVIPMGTDLRATFVPPRDSSTRSPNRLVFVGRLVEKKGVRYLLEAFAFLKDTHLDLRLVIVGDGPLRNELQRTAVLLGVGERVTFLGSLSHSELPALYQTAALAVFPFVIASDGDQEGSPVVVVEAMGCGCPVIASDVPALRQNIEPGVTGIITPSGDAPALAEAIRTALADASLRVRLADAALVKAREQFDWPAIASRYQRVVEELLNSAQQSPAVREPQMSSRSKPRP